MKWRFALRFLATFALLVGFWWLTDFGRLYRAAALATVETLSPLVNGWFLAWDQPGLADAVVFHSGDRRLPMLLQLQALSMGLMPFLSLVAATPGLGLKRGLITAVAGSSLFFGLHVTVILLYPVIMEAPNAFKDTIGVFSGLVAFVAAPLGLWFALTYPELRSVWQLTAR